MNKIAPYWKAFIAFIAPGAVVIESSVLENSAGGETITTREFVGAIVAAVVTAAGVYAKANHTVPDGDGKHRA